MHRQEECLVHGFGNTLHRNNFVQHTLYEVIRDPKKERIEIDIKKVNKIISDEISSFDKIRESLNGKEREIFDKIIRKCKENEIMFEAKSRQIKEELETKKTTANMKEDSSKEAEKTKFSNYMNS